MKRRIVPPVLLLFLTVTYYAYGAETAKYPPPRFPSYLKAPKSIDEVMPFARAAVRQTGGRTPLGLVEKGQTVLLVATDHIAEPMILEAIRRATQSGESRRASLRSMNSEA